MKKKKWLIFGLYGGLLNALLVFIYFWILFVYDSPGNLSQAFGCIIFPGFLLWFFGGLGYDKEYKFSDAWVPIFSLLTFILWGFCILVVTSYIWEPILYSLLKY